MQTLLHQRRFLVNATTVTLRDPYHIVVRERAGLSVTHHTIPLDTINPNPIRIQDVRLAWAVASALMICLTGAVLYGSFQPEGLHMGIFTIALMFGFLTTATVLKAIGEFRNLYVYTEPQTNRSLFVIHAKVPTAQAVETFVETLAQHITALRYPEGLSAQQRNEHHKKHVDFLLSEGVLTPEEHSAIMGRLEKKFRPAEVVKLGTSGI